MKIKRIVLYNVGPYVDRNVFDLSTDKKRNIVLIGGKNGAGKTTFFRSIKTCLYGCKVWGYEAPGKEYFNLIGNLVNTKMQYDSSVKAYVQIELVFDDGKQITSYVLHREWIKAKKNMTETFTIRKDGVLLGDEEQTDFNNYLLSIIPPDMFNFYFFDGESIADFFLGSNGGKNFRNAFLKLYGLDTLSLMVENFERYFKKKDGGVSALEVYQAAKKAVSAVEDELDALIRRKQEIESSIDLKQIRIASLQKDYTEAGGVSISEWKEINAELTKEEARRDEINRWLKEIANHYLPFVIVHRQLQGLLASLEGEQATKRSQILVDSLSTDDFKLKLSDYLKNCGVQETNIEDLISFICTESVGATSAEILFDLSDSQMNKLISQVYEKLDFDPTAITKALKKLSSSLSRSKKLRDKLTASSIDGFEDFSGQKERLEKELMQLTIDLERIVQEIQIKEADLLKVKADFEKAKESYERLLKSKSITELSTRAIGTYTLLEEKLIRRQGILLQEEFIKCFRAIINKENFVDGIVIDRNINVIPYKFIDVTFLQIENYMRMNEQTKFLSLFDSSYLNEINKLRLGQVETIRLPSPITAPFSQGERQVYIMSIYLALLKTSRKDIPFFIDTPFARIDSNHREKIVKEFFSVISNQMFILSTDEEIVGEYKALIDENISNEFMLSITNYGKTRVIPNSYFEV